MIFDCKSNSVLLIHVELNNSLCNSRTRYIQILYFLCWKKGHLIRYINLFIIIIMCSWSRMSYLYIYVYRCAKQTLLPLFFSLKVCKTLKTYFRPAAALFTASPKKCLGSHLLPCAFLVFLLWDVPWVFPAFPNCVLHYPPMTYYYPPTNGASWE